MEHDQCHGTASKQEACLRSVSGCPPTGWQPRLDSNQDKVIQSHLCYHYTTRLLRGVNRIRAGRVVHIFCAVAARFACSSAHTGGRTPISSKYAWKALPTCWL